MSLKSSWSVSDTTVDGLRDFLIDFWLHAPFDQLETLWKLNFGDLTIKLIQDLNPSFVFTPSQVQLRDTLGSYVNDNGLNDDYSLQVMIANMLLSPPGLFRINNIDDFFPSWFCDAYRFLYDNSNPDSLTPSSQISNTSDDSTSDVPDFPDFGPFPNSLHDLISNRIHLNRLLGLSNLYYIDPEDREICSDLCNVRTSLAQAITATSESELEKLWSTEFGDRYWALVRSGIQNEDLSPQDQLIKQDAVSRLNPAQNGGFGTPHAINAFLVAMMYFLPGTMRVDDPTQKIPAWILPHFDQIFLQAIPK